MQINFPPNNRDDWGQWLWQIPTVQTANCRDYAQCD